MRSGYPFIKNYNHIAKQFDLTPTENNLLSYILSYQESGKACTASIDTIASVININRRSVIRAIEKLKSKSLIEVSKSHNCNTYKANEYIIFDSDKMSYIKNDSDNLSETSDKMSLRQCQKVTLHSDKMSHNKIYLQDISIRQQTEPPFDGGGRYAEEEKEKKFFEKESEELNGEPQYTPFD